MKTDPLLEKAVRLAKKKDYESAVKILKAEEERYYGSFKYYYILAVICLHSGSHVEALANFRQARKIKMQDPSTMLGLAVLYLKRADTVQALDYYLDVKESEPKNKIAKRALSVIRKYASSDELYEWLTPERLEKLYPPVPSPSLSAKTIIVSAFLLAAAFILVFGILIKAQVISAPAFVKKPDVRHAAELTLSRQERSEPVQTGGTWSYILTQDQAVSVYDKALSLFTNYRDEAAKVNINRILESNASQGIKNKSRILLTYMEVPGFDSFNRNDNPSFEEVRNEPILYRDVHVIWRGMAANIEVTDEHTGFDLLVGYDTRTTLEGIIPVVFYSPVAVNNSRPLEVLGKITLSASNAISLEGVAVYQSGRLE